MERHLDSIYDTMHGAILISLTATPHDIVLESPLRVPKLAIIGCGICSSLVTEKLTEYLNKHNVLKWSSKL